MISLPTQIERENRPQRREGGKKERGPAVAAKPLLFSGEKKLRRGGEKKWRFSARKRRGEEAISPLKGGSASPQGRDGHRWRRKREGGVLVSVRKK